MAVPWRKLFNSSCFLKSMSNKFYILSLLFINNEGKKKRILVTGGASGQCFCLYTLPCQISVKIKIKMYL